MEADPQLLAAASAGDREAFGRFVRRHTAAVLRYCLLRVGDRHAAEDATQESMLRLYQQISARRVPDDPLPWLFAIARRCCQESARRLNRACAVRLPGDDLPDPEPASEEAPDLAGALASLNDFETALVHLKHTEGLRCEDISGRLGRPLGTVTAALSRAYSKLRARLSLEPRA
jgi:RNA polymerase sigma-70 factor (ECF subfamily)